MSDMVIWTRSEPSGSQAPISHSRVQQLAVLSSAFVNSAVSSSTLPLASILVDEFPSLEKPQKRFIARPWASPHNSNIDERVRLSGKSLRTLLAQNNAMKYTFWDDAANCKSSSQTYLINQEKFNTPGEYFDDVLNTLMIFLRTNQMNRWDIKKVIKSTYLSGNKSSPQDLVQDAKLMFGLMLRTRFVFRGSLGLLEHILSGTVFDTANRGEIREFEDRQTRSDAKLLWKTLYDIMRDLVSDLRKAKIDKNLINRGTPYDFITDDKTPKPLPLSDFILTDSTAEDLLAHELVADLMGHENPMARRFLCSIVLREISKMTKANSNVCFIRKYGQKWFGLVPMSKFRAEVLFRNMCNKERSQYLSFGPSHDGSKFVAFYDPNWTHDLMGYSWSASAIATAAYLFKPGSAAMNAYFKEAMQSIKVSASLNSEVLKVLKANKLDGTLTTIAKSNLALPAPAPADSFEKLCYEFSTVCPTVNQFKYFPPKKGEEKSVQFIVRKPS